MGLLDTNYSTVNGKNPRKSDRQQPEGMQSEEIRGLLAAFDENLRKSSGLAAVDRNIAMRGLDGMAGGDIQANRAANSKEQAAKAIDIGLNFNPAAVGMFIGKGAKTWDAVKAADAEKRIAAGADPRQVWKETGTFKGPDGHLRQEIDDSGAFFNFSPKYFGSKAASGKTSQLYEHPELYKSYPESADTITRMRFDSGNKGGSYGSDGISINVSNPLDGETIISHELQHAIQQREGWALGGSLDNAFMSMGGRKFRELVNELKPDVAKLGMDESSTNLTAWERARNVAYQRLAGEAEARATQARMNMNMDQRINTYPLDSYDVPVDQLIIRGGLLK